MVIKKLDVLLDLTKVVITKGWYRIVLLVIVSIYYHSRLHPESLDLWTVDSHSRFCWKCAQTSECDLLTASDPQSRSRIGSGHGPVMSICACAAGELIVAQLCHYTTRSSSYNDHIMSTLQTRPLISLNLPTQLYAIILFTLRYMGFIFIGSVCSNYFQNSFFFNFYQFKRAGVLNSWQPAL